MKKIVIHSAGGYDRLKLEEIKTDNGLRPGAGEVLVKTEAVGVNYADCIVRMGLYETAKKYVGWPITPGFEFAGRVLEVGEGVSNVAAGDRVVGLSRFGAYATHLVAPAHQIFRLPESLKTLEAGGFPVIFFTAYYPLNVLLRTRKGMRVLVHSAAGGVGSALVQLAKLGGCEVTAVVGAPH